MGIINALFYMQYRYEQQNVIDNAPKKFHEARQVLHMSRMEHLSFDELKERLQQVLNVQLLRVEDAGDFQQGRLLHEQRHLTVYAYKENIYLHFNDPRRQVEHVIRYHDEKLGNKRILFFAFAIDLSVLLFFIYVIRRIWPLRDLKNAISDFSQGNLNIHTHINGKDEIADVANEFDRAIAKIKQLQGSRNLFLRNIMHELKTPIAKGKLISDLLEDEKNATRLKQIFIRFEHLLGEFSKIERVTSNDMSLNKRKYRTVDILDNAIDILMIDKEAIEINIEKESEVEADFELLSVALKNLIDNALKYGTSKPLIRINETTISVISTGDELDEAMFENIFNRQFEDSSKGLGLGLYLTKSIVEKHGFSFEYAHKDGSNRFTLHF
jgi:two-component system OmpR family sensor kinase